MRDGKVIINWGQPFPSEPGLLLLPVGCRFAWHQVCLASGMLGTHSIRRGRPPYLGQAAWPPIAVAHKAAGSGDQEYGIRARAVTQMVD